MTRKIGEHVIFSFEDLKYNDRERREGRSHVPIMMYIRRYAAYRKSLFATEARSRREGKKRYPSLPSSSITATNEPTPLSTFPLRDCIFACTGPLLIRSCIYSAARSYLRFIQPSKTGSLVTRRRRDRRVREKKTTSAMTADFAAVVCVAITRRI